MISFLEPEVGLRIVDAEGAAPPATVVAGSFGRDPKAANANASDMIDGFSTWSPDAREILFGKYIPASSGFAAETGARIFRVNTNGTNCRQILQNAYCPSWSPDGNKIMYLSG